MRRIARPFIPWVGGKEKLAPYIRQVLPTDFKTYVEPFGGSGAILLGLPPNSQRLDIYNDYNSDLVNLFLCARDRPLALLKELNFLPIHSRTGFEYIRDALKRKEYSEEYFQYCREEMEIAKEMFTPEQAGELIQILQERMELMDVRRAAAYFTISRGSFSGTTTSFGVKACDVRQFFYLLWEASRRLRNVVIENMDGAALVAKRDDSSTLFYCDPPYYKAEQHYQMVFSREAHILLHEAVSGCKGSVVVSYNDCDFIRELYRDFFILAFTRNNPLSQQSGSVYGEVILTNYDPRAFIPQMNLFECAGSWGNMELVHIPDKPLKKL